MGQSTGCMGGAPDLGVRDVVCLSHLRWNFVFQRPQHLMSRMAAGHRVFFVEEPVWDETGEPRLETRVASSQVTVATPHVSPDVGSRLEECTLLQRRMLDGLIEREGISDYLMWYYTPIALRFSAHLVPTAIVYDCMDELSAFIGAPPDLGERERELLARADVVFTGGRSLYEAKRERHWNVHCFPSSVDVAHFIRAREVQSDPQCQAAIPHPRIGYSGVIDERMDLDLIAGLSREKPDWQFVLVGPVVKIAESSVPSAVNIHRLGMKSYDELPALMSGWDVAILPFARNDATRFISPTKTPEYLAAGLPVVSTSIRDVVRPYGERGLVRIADSLPDFAGAIEAALATDLQSHRAAADAALSELSWDDTVADMAELVRSAVAARRWQAIESRVASSP